MRTHYSRCPAPIDGLGACNCHNPYEVAVLRRDGTTLVLGSCPGMYGGALAGNALKRTDAREVTVWRRSDKTKVFTVEMKR